MCFCIYSCIYTHVYIHMHIYICMYVYMYICMCRSVDGTHSAVSHAEPQSRRELASGPRSLHALRLNMGYIRPESKFQLCEKIPSKKYILFGPNGTITEANKPKKYAAEQPSKSRKPQLLRKFRVRVAMALCEFCGLKL